MACPRVCSDCRLAHFDRIAILKTGIDRKLSFERCESSHSPCKSCKEIVLNIAPLCISGPRAAYAVSSHGVELPP